MEAIYTRGPMTVSVNAEGEDWRFYKAGVYNNTACSPKLKRLDHAVVVSGCVRLCRSPAASVLAPCMLSQPCHRPCVEVCVQLPLC